jgi:hypothetical protein
MTKLIKCESCGHEVARDALLCPECGHQFVLDSFAHGLGIIFVCCFLLALVAMFGWWGLAISVALVLMYFGGRRVQRRKHEAEAAKPGQIAAGWKRGQERAAQIRARGEERRQRQLAWMGRHWATRWSARLNRRLFG